MLPDDIDTERMEKFKGWKPKTKVPLTASRWLQIGLYSQY